MEVNKRASIKSIPYDEFKDNDTLEKIAQELTDGCRPAYQDASSDGG